MSTVKSDFLEAIRVDELHQVEAALRDFVAPGARILEIGAGTGWQARELTLRGYDVVALDIPTSNHGKARIWPILDFDGRHLPFPDQSFDVVYSSNVLEHVEDIHTLNSEMGRVLRPGGYAMHFVPTSTWRLWSLLAFYPALAKDAATRLHSRLSPPLAPAAQVNSAKPVAGAPKRPPLAVRLIKRLLPHAHGARGTFIGEVGRFSQRSWNRFFEALGWQVRTYGVNSMFLTGEMLLGPHLSVPRRRQLSRALGCTAHLYVLSKQSSPRAQ